MCRVALVEPGGLQSTPLHLEHVGCCVCGRTDGEPVGVGEDFEYGTCADSFLALQCRSCEVVYIDPRPAPQDFGSIYPDNYHAFDFSTEQFGLVYRFRRRLEARRLLRYIGSVPANAKIIDVGCGDGFHLSLLADFGAKTWITEGVDVDARAVQAALRNNVTVHHGHLEQLELEPNSYDVALMIQTVEHLFDPVGVVNAVRKVLKPGGRLIVVTDNTGSMDFRLFRSRHWGGYHFPRHFNLFNERSMLLLAHRAGFGKASVETIVSPVNWVYSVRNMLVDYKAPKWLVNRFSLSSVGSLTLFTVFDGLHQALGRGALLCATLERSE